VDKRREREGDRSFSEEGRGRGFYYGSLNGFDMTFPADFQVQRTQRAL
jgi:hypothetical protein